ncbi:MAG: 3-phosphoshikimate 1-carboxyvinyltransferase [Deltaproteobacteria bacterium]|nr:3-phosphoshikimate 1-carboxyvinyltransferase [Deltaproteobacteria bacterium]
MKSLIISPLRKPMAGVVTVPGDKSISHRALIFGAIAEGITQITGLLEADDVMKTVEILKELGVTITRQRPGQWRVKGVGLRGLRAPKKILYCGNSGTTLRLMTGLLSGQPFQSVLTGDASLNARPMGRVIEPLQRMGARIVEEKKNDLRLIRIKGSPLKGISYTLPVASAQLKSAILLAGLCATGPTTVIEPTPSRDHTERMLSAFGLSLKKEGKKTTLVAGQKLKGIRVLVPGDLSSAAFFVVASLLQSFKTKSLTIRGVGINPTRTGFLDVIKIMGGRIQLEKQKIVAGEPMADLKVFPSVLKGTAIRGALIPRLIDEIPILALAALMAKGETIIQDAAELRVKETDRIKAMATEFSRVIHPKAGGALKELVDGLKIRGERRFKGRPVKSYGDHRIAMSLTIAGLLGEGIMRVQDTDCIGTSFPTFVPLLRRLTGSVREIGD